MCWEKQYLSFPFTSVQDFILLESSESKIKFEKLLFLETFNEMHS